MNYGCKSSVGLKTASFWESVLELKLTLQPFHEPYDRYIRTWWRVVGWCHFGKMLTVQCAGGYLGHRSIDYWIMKLFTGEFPLFTAFLPVASPTCLPAPVYPKLPIHSRGTSQSRVYRITRNSRLGQLVEHWPTPPEVVGLNPMHPGHHLNTFWALFRCARNVLISF